MLLFLILILFIIYLYKIKNNETGFYFYLFCPQTKTLDGTSLKNNNIKISKENKILKNTFDFLNCTPGNIF